MLRQVMTHQFAQALPEAVVVFLQKHDPDAMFKTHTKAARLLDKVFCLQVLFDQNWVLPEQRQSFRYTIVLRRLSIQPGVVWAALAAPVCCWCHTFVEMWCGSRNCLCDIPKSLLQSSRCRYHLTARM